MNNDPNNDQKWSHDRVLFIRYKATASVEIGFLSELSVMIQLRLI